MLEAKGFDVTQADFLTWACSTTDRFDRVVMNPPFSDGRWSAHLHAAAGLVTQGGKITAVLPAGAKNKDLLPGFELTWSRVIENAFSSTTVSVVILSARRP